MRIAVQCSCGKVLQVDTRFAGTTRKCVFCGSAYKVPGMDDAALSGTILDGELNDVVRTMQHRSDTRPQWANRYWWVMLALLPLLIFTFNREETNFEEKIHEAAQQMTESDKKTLKRYEDMAGEDGAGMSIDLARHMVRIIPEHKLSGALVTYDSMAHWLLAFISAGAFLALTITLFPSRTTQPANLAYVALFTGTAGIMLLLLVQYIAFSPFPHDRSGIIILLLMIFKLIGFSYMAALNPDCGFIVSLLGFTFGVGLCEEFCKIIPVFYHFRRKNDLDWRGACAWGLASGIGFGVSEGISYSSEFYNGILGGDIYLVRFISCVALHAVWSASAGISLWKKQDEIRGDKSIGEVFLNMVGIVIVPMLLHGLYDTLLKKDIPVGALITALLSVAWLAWTIEDAKKLEVQMDLQPA